MAAVFQENDYPFRVSTRLLRRTFRNQEPLSCWDMEWHNSENGACSWPLLPALISEP